MPFPYQIGAAEFAQWRGPPPSVFALAAQGHTRPGVRGVAFHETWDGSPFVVELESWHTSLEQAELSLLTWQANWQGRAHDLIYGGLNWSQHSGAQFFVSQIQIVSLRVYARVTGFDVDQENAGVLVTRWTLTPVG